MKRYLPIYIVEVTTESHLYNYLNPCLTLRAFRTTQKPILADKEHSRLHSTPPRRFRAFTTTVDPSLVIEGDNSNPPRRLKAFTTYSTPLRYWWHSQPTRHLLGDWRQSQPTRPLFGTGGIHNLLDPSSATGGIHNLLDPSSVLFAIKTRITKWNLKSWLYHIQDRTYRAVTIIQINLIYQTSLTLLNIHFFP